MAKSDPFKRTIEAYMTERAKKNLKLMQRFKDPNKSIDECCKYIFSEVQKSKREGFLDEEIFGMAMHYYLEDNVKATGNFASATVKVNHIPELTEEEKEELRKEARDKVLQEEMDKIRGKNKKKTKEPEIKQGDMFSMFSEESKDEEE